MPAPSIAAAPEDRPHLPGAPQPVPSDRIVECPAQDGVRQASGGDRQSFPLHVGVQRRQMPAGECREGPPADLVGQDVGSDDLLVAVSAERLGEAGWADPRGLG
jgi:hypothetical protein